MALLELRELTKSFGGSVVVDNIDLDVAKGQIFALLGPNGAGKTTTISMLSGVLAPSSGSASVDGLDIVRSPKRARAAIGLVPQDLALYESLNARQNLSFFGSLYGLRGAALEQRIDWALDIAGLRDRSREPVSHFSGGMKRRLNLSAGVLHKPSLLVLDEPTVGVDPQSRLHIFECLRALRDEHDMTILYTSHYLDEVQELCKRVAIMDKGRILACDDVSVLLARQERAALRLDLDGEARAAEELARPFGETSIIDGQLHVVLRDGFAPLVAAIENAGFEIRSMQTLEPDLESLFMRLTGHQLRDS